MEPPDVTVTASAGIGPGAPRRELGPPVLGLRISDPTADGEAVRWSVALPSGLDGPPGVLQGGLASALLLALAREVDVFGAPLHELSVRLHAPTTLGRTLQAVARPAGVGRHRLELRDGERVHVTAEADMTGGDPLAASDLVALAAGPLPPPAPSRRYPTCFACGPDAVQPAALHAPPGWVTDDAVLIGWVPDPVLADPGRPGALDVAPIAAVLACAGAWATYRPAVAAGAGAVLLGSLRLRTAADVEPLDPVRVAARLDGLEGRRARARSAVIDTDGRVLALVDATYVAVDALPGE